MICQRCGAQNAGDDGRCHRCDQRLLVVSGALGVEASQAPDDDAISLDEHLLERLSLLEEVVRRMAETVHRLSAAVRGQEEELLAHEAGLAALGGLLDRRALLPRSEWEADWSREQQGRMADRERGQRLAAARERLLAHHRGGDPETLGGLLDRAELAFRRREGAAAMGLLEEAYRRDRDNPELAHLLGDAYLTSGEGTKALACFQQLLRCRPDDEDGLVYTGVLLHETAQERGSLRLLERAARLYPERFLPHYSLGAVRASQGELARAVRALERAVAVEPAPHALVLLGRCLCDLGKAGAAVVRFEEAAQRDPGSAEALHHLALAYAHRGWRRKAVAAIRRAEGLCPRRLTYRALELRLAGQAGDPLPSAGGPAADWLRRGEAALDRHRPRQAYRCVRRALAAAPRHPTPLLWGAVTALAAGHPRAAEGLARRATAATRDELPRATAYVAWSQALHHQGRFREGSEVAGLLLGEARTAAARAAARYGMAANLVEVGAEALEQAETCAHEALEEAPDELRPYALALVGWIRYKGRAYREAVDMLTRASELVPSAQTLERLGLALVASGRGEQGRSLLERARSAPRYAGGAAVPMLECMRDVSCLRWPNG